MRLICLPVWAVVSGPAVSEPPIFDNFSYCVLVAQVVYLVFKGSSFMKLNCTLLNMSISLDLIHFLPLMR